MRKENSLGTVGFALMENIADARKKQNLTYAALSARLAAIDRHIPALGLSRIERGERRVDADDLVALSRVLEVNILTLLGQQRPAHREAILDCQDFLIRVQVTRGEITAASRA